MDGMRIHRRTLLAAGRTGMGSTATQRLAAAPSTRTRFVFLVSSTWGDLFDWLVDRGYRPIMAKLEKRGFPSMLVHSSVRGSDTPNEDRASAIVKALEGVTDPVVIVGISNQGSFLPLVAAARPIRRVVYVNARIPRPGRHSLKSAKRSRSPYREAISIGSLRKHHGCIYKTQAHPQRHARTDRSNAGTHRHLFIRSYLGRLLRSLPTESAAEGRQRVCFGIS